MTVAFGDLAQAAELADVDLHDVVLEGVSDEDLRSLVVRTINGMTGGPISVDGTEGPSPVAAVPPDAAHVERLASIVEFFDEVGWSVFDVDRFVEYQVPPNVVTVMEGDFDEDLLTEALGEPEDDVWVVGNPDGSLDMTEVSAARPLGEPLWLWLSGDTLVITRNAEDMAAVKESDDESGDLADDEVLLALAQALDEEDVYSALLYEGDSKPLLPRDGSNVDERMEDLVCGEALPESFAGVGAGIVDDDGQVVVLAYVNADDEAAAANAEALEALVTDGSSAMTREPWSDMFTVDAVDTEGNVTVARLRPTEPASARVWRELLLQRDNLVTAC